MISGIPKRLSLNAFAQVFANPLKRSRHFSFSIGRGELELGDIDIIFTSAINHRKAKDGKGRRPGYTPGVDLLARATLLGEGCRGSLSEVGLRGV